MFLVVIAIFPTMVINTNRYRYRYSMAEMYRALKLVYPSIAQIRRNKKTQIIDEDFVERLMLAVTEVNGCSVCSYAHTKMALESGFTEEEIDSFLTGSEAYVKPEEAKAILFAQSYADAHGVFASESYESLVETYGRQKSEVILAATRVMMVGNILGLPMSAFLSRMKGKPYENSSLFYELFMILVPLILFPLSALAVLFRKLGRR
jgi:AhpD family alkylhydroperoxidase